MQAEASLAQRTSSCLHCRSNSSLAELSRTKKTATDTPAAAASLSATGQPPANSHAFPAALANASRLGSACPAAWLLMPLPLLAAATGPALHTRAAPCSRMHSRLGG